MSVLIIFWSAPCHFSSPICAHMLVQKREKWRRRGREEENNFFCSCKKTREEIQGKKRMQNLTCLPLLVIMHTCRRARYRGSKGGEEIGQERGKWRKREFPFSRQKFHSCHARECRTIRKKKGRRKEGKKREGWDLLLSLMHMHVPRREGREWRSRR